MADVGGKWNLAVILSTGDRIITKSKGLYRLKPDKNEGGENEIKCQML